MTGGLHKGELIILAARPSMGKTALALNIASHVAMKLGQTVAVFSLENCRTSRLRDGPALWHRLMSTASDSAPGYLNQDERRKLAKGGNEMVQAPLYVDVRRPST